MRDTASSLLAWRRWPAAFRVGLGLWLFLALLIQVPQWRLAEYKGFDLLSVAAAPQRSSLPITLVGIDEESFAEIGRQWPWPRSLHGQLVEALSEAGAAVIVFDIVFAEPSEQGQDRYFAEAIARAGNVVLASDMVYQETAYVRQWLRADPLPLLREAGAGAGLAAVPFDADMVVRSMPDAQDALWRQVIARFERARPGLFAAETPPRPGSMIRYLGPDHTYPYVSYYQALRPAEFLPKGFFKDQIVFVGRNVRSSPDAGSAQADMFATPFLPITGWLTPGVEIQATLLEDALRGLSLRPAPAGAVLALLTFALVLAGLGMQRWHPGAAAAVALALILAIAGLDGWLFQFRNVWLPALSAVLAVALMYLSLGGVAYFAERRQRQNIKRTFSLYVAPEVVDEMIAHPERLALGGERREITLLFTDLADFTSLSEKLAPEQVAQLLNSHLTQMTEIIMRYGGTVDKFIGDAIMAFWGAPLADPDHALHACQAARDMQAAMASRRKTAGEGGAVDLHMRIGIHTGEAIVGNMGSTDRFDYTAIGDNVNLASRLEGVNKLYGTGILISEATAQRVAGRLPLRKVDKVKVKGRQQDVEIYTPEEEGELCDKL